MGSSATLYVGPIAIFDKIPKKVGQELSTARVCVNTGCEKHKTGNFYPDANFCPICGSSIAEGTKETDYDIGWIELIEDTEFEEVFMICNEGNGFKRLSSVEGLSDELLVVCAFADDANSDVADDVNGGSTVLFTHEVDEIVNQMRRFRDKYVKELDKYESILGPYKIVWSSNIASS